MIKAKEVKSKRFSKELSESLDKVTYPVYYHQGNYLIRIPSAYGDPEISQELVFDILTDDHPAIAEHALLKILTLH